METKRSWIHLRQAALWVLAFSVSASAGRAQLFEAGNQLWNQELEEILGDADSRDEFSSATAVGDFNGDGIDDLAIGVPGESVSGNQGAGAVNVIYGSNTGLSSPGNQTWHQNSDGIEGTAQAGDNFGAAVAAGDFDADGFDDLAIGVPSELAGAPLAGGVNVLYGSADGLRDEGNQFWSQISVGIQGEPSGGDNFGAALATGDFDGDGFDDLAVGAPRDDLDDVLLFGSGSVNIIFGDSGGLTSSGDEFWHQNIAGITGTADRASRFGSALAAGDFDNDGFDDLVVGAPGHPVDGDLEAGAVNVIYGTEDGLTTEGEQFWTQDSEEIVDVTRPSERFGAALAAGDFNGDEFDDLAIGVPDEDIGGDDRAGAVNVIYGSSDRLTSTGNQFWNRDTTGVLESARDDERFGSALAAGDFDNDGFDDLAIGVPFAEVDDVPEAGAVNVLYGRSSDGLSGTGDQVWSQGSDGIEGTLREGDAFGGTLTAGDFNHDGFDDLGIGAPGERIDSLNRAGAVNVIYGASDEVSAFGIVSAASFLPGVVAPGEIISVFVGGAGPPSPPEGTPAGFDASGRLPTAWVDTQIFFDDVPAPLFFVGPNQLNAQVPYAVDGSERTSVQIFREGNERNPAPISLAVAPSVPELFMVPGSEPQVIAVHLDDGSLNSLANRVSSGEFITLYATGEGQTSPAGEDGARAEEPLPEPLGRVRVKFAGDAVDPSFAGSAPGFAGLMQVNVRVPSGVSSGSAVPITLCVGDTESLGGATIAIE